jgi:hypothetical protein
MKNCHVKLIVTNVSVEIQGANSCNICVPLMGDQSLDTYTNVKGEEYFNEEGNTSTNYCLMRVTFAVKIELNLMTEHVFFSQEIRNMVKR